MEIRALKIDDYDSYCIIRERALNEVPSAFSSTNEDEKETRKIRFESIANHDFNFIMGAFNKKELVGMVGFVKGSGKKTNHKGLIWGVFVFPEKQGLGIASKLMSATLEKAFKIEELLLIQLGVSSTNEPAIKLYQKFGFTNYGLEEKAIKVDGKFYDEYLMVKFK